MRRVVQHAVQAAQEGRLAAAGGADDGRDAALGDIQADPVERLERAVIDAELLRAHLRLHRRVGTPRLRSNVRSDVEVHECPPWRDRYLLNFLYHQPTPGCAPAA